MLLHSLKVGQSVIASIDHTSVQLRDSLRVLLYSFSKDMKRWNGEEQRNSEIDSFEKNLRQLIQKFIDSDTFNRDEIGHLLKNIIVWARANETFVRDLGNTKATRFADALLTSNSYAKKLKV